ncbi:hypothetical protein [Marmoricola sp. RAF53]|uniref:hypothetical protein n=1 Tax=Marmoricola sp. RAF53 TaxID=3233059 RepID=UPI003F9B7D13
MSNQIYCYRNGCDAEHEILMHVRAEPEDGYVLLCEVHAIENARKSDLVLRCNCPWCSSARTELLHLGLPTPPLGRRRKRSDDAP